MATISQAPATLDLVAVKGDDLTVTLTVTENGSAYDWTGATVASSILDSSGTEVATDFTVTTSAGGILTLTLTDANTTTLGVATYRWQVNVTKASATRTWLAGALSVMQPGWGGTSTSSASLSITTGAATIAISNIATVASSVSVADTANYYAATNVETVLAEQALKTRVRLSTTNTLPLASLTDLATPTPTFATSGPGGATPITSAVTLAYNTTNVRTRGCIGTLFQQFSTNYLRNNINGSWTTPPWWIEFDYYGSDFAIRFRNVSANNSQFWVWVDGKPTTTTAQTSTAASAGSLFYYRVTFGSVAQRRIRVFLRLADFGGLDIGPTDTVSPTTQTSRKVVFYGDSWIEGSGSTTTDDVLWSARVGESLRADWYRLGQGGTGFVANGGGGSKAAFTDTTRLSTLTTLQPDLVVLCGSINDDGLSGVTAAVQSVLTYIQTNCPSTSVVLASAPPTSGSPSANRVSNASAVLAGASGYTNVIATIDQVTTPWITGTGRVGATTGSGNADLFVFSDGSHLTQAGHSYWSSRMQAEIIRILSTYSTP